MKNLILGLLLAASGVLGLSGITVGVPALLSLKRTGMGSFTGRLVDVAWDGIIFKSCEIEVIRGEQGSSVSHASSKSRQACDIMRQSLGKVVSVTYETRMTAPVWAETEFLIEDFVEHP